MKLPEVIVRGLYCVCLSVAVYIMKKESAQEAFNMDVLDAHYFSAMGYFNFLASGEFVVAVIVVVVVVAVVVVVVVVVNSGSGGFNNSYTLIGIGGFVRGHHCVKVYGFQGYNIVEIDGEMSTMFFKNMTSHTFQVRKILLATNGTPQPICNQFDI